MWWACQIKMLFSWIQSLSLTCYREMCLALHPSLAVKCRSGEVFPVRLDEFAEGFHESLLSTNSKNAWDQSSHLCAHLYACVCTFTWAPLCMFLCRYEHVSIYICILNQPAQKKWYSLLYSNTLVCNIWNLYNNTDNINIM